MGGRGVQIALLLLLLAAAGSPQSCGAAPAPLCSRLPFCTITPPPPPCLAPAAGTRFRADVQRLQGELWDEELSLDFDSMMGEQRDKVRGGYLLE